ncbi:MAG: PA2169 family four-helix-bundle protein [Burkholderiales bacterium]
MSNQSSVIKLLNDLIETCKDGEYGFRISGDQTKSAELKSMLQQRAADCAAAAAQLQDQVFALGGSPDTGGSIGGALHRGWVSVKTTLTGFDDLAVMEECERGEDSALASYRDALKDELPPPIRGLVEQQYEGVKRNHQIVRDKRDALKRTT